MSDTFPWPSLSGLWWSAVSSPFTLLTQLELYVWVNKHSLLRRCFNSMQPSGISPALCTATVPCASTLSPKHTQACAPYKAMMLPLLNRQIGPVITTERHINRAADFTPPLRTPPLWLSLKVLSGPEGLFIGSSYAAFDLRVCPHMHVCSHIHTHAAKESICSNSWDDKQKYLFNSKGFSVSHTTEKSREAE